MPNKIQYRRDTAANWTAANPVLAEGEPGIEKDTKRRKVGDGVSAWNTLDYQFDRNEARINDVGATAALMQNLDAGAASCAIQVLGDSTGVSNTRWPYLMGQYLAAKYPAFTVKHRLWNDTNQTYDAPTVIQTGTGGAEPRYGQLTGTNNVWLYQPQSTSTDISGDLDVSMNVALEAWKPAAQMTLASKFGPATPNRAWRFSVRTTGLLELQWSPDGGTTLPTAASTVAPTVADGASLYVRATLQVNTPSGSWTVTFYTSTDGYTWTQLGGAVTATGSTSMAAVSSNLELGGRSNGSDLLKGKIYSVHIRRGINGPTVAPVNPESWPALTNNAGTVNWGGTPVLEIINGSKSGAGLVYLNDTTRQPIMTPDYGTLLTFLSTSHNDGNSLGPTLLSQWDTMLTGVKSRLPMAAVVAVGQNPRATPAASITQHAGRLAQIAGWAQRNGVKFINVYRAFTDYLTANPTVTLTSLLDNLGIHPTDAAYASVYWPAMRTMFERRS